MDGEVGQHRLPRVVADQRRHSSERGIEGAQLVAGREPRALFEAEILNEVELAVDVHERASLGVGRAVVRARAVALVEAEERGRPVLGQDQFVGADGGVGPGPSDRVAAQLELGKDDEVGSGGACLGEGGGGAAAVLFHVAEPAVELSKRDAHGQAATSRRAVSPSAFSRSAAGTASS